MVEHRRGTVVTIASAAGLVGVARQTDSSASKFAAFGFAGRSAWKGPKGRPESPARVLPLSLFDRLVNQPGINNTMDHFVGRTRR